MKKIISILTGIALTISGAMPILTADAEEEPALLTLEACNAIRNSATFFFNKEVDLEKLDFTLIDDEEPETEREVTVLSDDNKAVTVKFAENLEANKNYTLSVPAVIDADKRSILYDISMNIQSKGELYSDDFEDYSSVNDFAEKYRYKRNDGISVDILPQYQTTFAIDTTEDGNKRLAINLCDQYRRLMPKVSDESVFKNYILEYTVANGQSAQHGLVAYQGNAAYDANALTVKSAGTNGMSVISGNGTVSNVAKISSNNDTVLTFDMSGGKAGGELSIYIDGVNELNKLATKYYGDYGLFGFYMLNGTAPLYIDNIYAYQMSSSLYSDGDSVEIKALTPELSCEEFENGRDIVCSIGEGADVYGIDVVYDWYVSKEENQYPQSDDQWEMAVEESDSNTYNIENDKKYVKCIVKQKLGELVLNEYSSAALFKEMPPFINIKDGAPVAELVKNNDTLTASYEYVDANADKEQGTTIEWFTSKDTDASKNWELKKTAVINDGDENNDYAFDVTDMLDTFVKCVITVRSECESESAEATPVPGTEEDEPTVSTEPEASAEPEALAEPDLGEQTDEAAYTGEPVELFYTLPFRPVAKDVKITGTKSVGNILKASYTYYDENGDEENTSETKIEWYSVGNLRTLLGSGATYAIKSTDAGALIECEVTPFAKEAPYSGDTVLSPRVAILNKSVSSSDTATGKTNGVTIDGGASNPASSLIGNPYVDKSTFVPSEASVFKDTNGHWAKDDIEALYKKDIINGRSNDLFESNETITRAEWVVLLMRAAQIDTENVKWQNCFADVDRTAWYALAVQAAFDNNLIQGGEDGEFYPEDSITREAMVKMLVDVCEYCRDQKLNSEFELSFNDNDKISDWAESYVRKAVRAGLISGNTENYFNPQAASTRAEAATVLARMLKLL